ncbi:glycoside hydrolase family 16 protein [Alphaproteobacteria bacterium]|nr:glycoside hydrolase family 16 protein [Alphaproteobacteria bacterium]MDB2641839.1 glycoside hydrolase family 16 protein [Alphaproteobacteria bacterium]
MSQQETFLPRLLVLCSLLICGIILPSAALDRQGHLYSSDPVALWTGLQLQSLDVSDDFQSIDISVPFPAIPYFPKLTYHRQAFESKLSRGRWHSGGAHSMKAHLPFGLTFEAGQRLDNFGRRDDEFVGLTFTYSHLRNHHENWHHGRLGADRGAQIPQDLRKSESGGRFWKIAGSVALVAALAGGGGGGGGGGGSGSGSGSGSDSLSDTLVNNNPIGADGWQLVWQDAFDGNELNTDNWTARDSYNREDVSDLGACWGGGNNEAQCYTSRPENVSVIDGNLVLTALVENYTATNVNGQSASRNYTSGRIQTRNKQDFKYGRFEARIKLPSGDGVWPAFWMLPTDQVYGTWPFSGEIDIMENADGNGQIGGAIHYNNPNSAVYNNIYQTRSTAATPTDWNVYRVDWDQNNIRWYLNGENYYQVNKASWRNGPHAVGTSDHAPFDQDFHLILNLALGGGYTGGTVDDTAFGVDGHQMLVDYVKVYECAAGANAC